MNDTSLQWFLLVKSQFPILSNKIHVQYYTTVDPKHKGTSCLWKQTSAMSESTFEGHFMDFCHWDQRKPTEHLDSQSVNSVRYPPQ